MIEMVPTLSPRTYFFVDRASKLLALFLVVSALMGIAGSLSLLLGVVGIVVGIVTIFIEVEE